MEYSNELLLSQDGLKELLLDHKSNLQDLADELTVAVGTLKKLFIWTDFVREHALSLTP